MGIFTSWFMNNMDIVYFLYGNAFVLLGLIVLFRPMRDSDFTLGKVFWLLAAFGLVHGLYEWMDMWRIIKQDAAYPERLRLALLLLSYIFLFEFGRRLILLSQPLPLLRYLASPWIYLLPAAGILTSGLVSPFPLHDLNIAIRYCVGFTGAVMAATGFLVYARFESNRLESLGIRRYFYWTAFFLLCYAIMGGLIGPRADYFPANTINQAEFLTLTHIPVQVFRALFAGLLAFFVLRTSRIFHLEAQSKLSNALAMTERLLRETQSLNQQNQLILNAAGEGIVELDQAGHVLFANPAATQLLGYTREEMLGRLFCDLHKYHHNTQHDCPISACLKHPVAGKTNYYGENLVFENKARHQFPVDWSCTLIMEGDACSSAVVTFSDISERKKVEAEIKQASDTYITLFNEAPGAYFSVGEHGRILRANHAASWLTGHPLDDLHQMNIMQLYDEDFLAAADDLSCTLACEVAVCNAEIIFKHKSGQRVHGLLSVNLVLDEADQILVRHAVVTDISNMKQAEAHLQLAAQVFENSAEAIIITDKDNRIVRVNHVFSEITGYSETEVFGQSPALLKSGRQDEAFYQQLWHDLGHYGNWQGELWNRRKNGEIYPEHLTISAIKDGHGAVRNYMAIFTDLTSQQQRQAEIQRLVFYDVLTGLPNRLMFRDRLEQALQNAQDGGSSVAVLYIDLDRFQAVNNAMGHVIGDKLLEYVAARLSSCVHEEDTVARMGSDEFGIILANIEGKRVAETVAKKILHSLKSHFELHGNDIYITASIGIALSPNDGQTVNDLIKNADAAIHYAKRFGNQYQFYNSDANASKQHKVQLETQLRRALDREEFVIHYQPQVTLATGQITGVEALIRWQHPEHGLMLPGSFISVLEETGLIIELSHWILMSVCNTNLRWQRAGHTLRSAVNISPRQFSQRNLVSTIQSIIDVTAVNPRLIELEITETSVMEDASESIIILNDLHDMGIHLSVDDFGTGYSSLSYLKHFPIDVLKIDQSFIRGIPADPDDVAITNAIIAMAHNLNLEVIAEGIETQEQLRYLQASRCEIGQGYLFSKPLTEEEFLALYIRSQNPEEGGCYLSGYATPVPPRPQ